MARLCNICESIIPSRIKIGNKIHNLSSRKNCLGCIPFGSRHRNLSTDERIKLNREKQRQWCKTKTQKLGKHPITYRREVRKKWLVTLVGGECQICHYNRCFKNLAFHHLFNKQFMISSAVLRMKASLVIKEVMKCILVCHNCHGEIHEGLINVNFELLNAAVVKVLSNYRSVGWPLESMVTDWSTKITNLICPVCNKKFKPKNHRLKYCSHKCARKAKQKIAWPIDLPNLIKASTISAVARTLKVSDRAVKKRLLRHHSGVV